jgi:NAD(P)H dehydrogenase (quinone)
MSTAARAAGAEVRVHRAGAMRFDPILHEGYNEIQPLEPDLVELQRDIEWSDHLVVFAPLWWGSVPAALKGLFDRAFLPGWAFRYEQGKSVPTPLLRGRTSRFVLTMDAPGWWYWLNYRGSAHGSMVRATLKFVGFDTTTTTLSKVGSVSDAKRQGWLAQLARHGQADAVAKPTRQQRRLHAAAQARLATATPGPREGLG